MPNKTAAALVLRNGDRPQLEALLRSNSVPAGVAQRARIVLLAAEGVANYEIAERVGVTRPTVNLWRNRYAGRGLAGLDGVRPQPRLNKPTGHTPRLLKPRSIFWKSQHGSKEALA